MAPRGVKAKKAADVKVSENDVPKKGKGKAKTIEEVGKEIEDIAEVGNGDVVEKAPVEKNKREKKAQEHVEQVGNEDIPPPAKRGRKKNAEPTIDSTVPEPVDSIPIEEANVPDGNGLADKEPENEPGDDHAEQDNIEEEPKSTSKAKKMPKKQAKSKEVEENGDAEEKVPEKPKGKGRGRKAQPKPEPEVEEEDIEDIELPEKTELAKPKRGRKPAAKEEKQSKDNNVEEKPEKVKKGRGRAAKAVESPEPDDDVSEEPEPVMEAKPKKAPAKGRGRGKKVVASKEAEDEEINDEVEPKEPASKKRKVNKRTEKEDVDDNGTEDAEELPVETKVKGKRGQKKAVTAPEVDSEPTDEMGEDNGTEDTEEVLVETKVKGKRGQKKAVTAPEVDAEPEDTGESRRKPTDEKAPAKESKQKAPLKNKSSTVYEDIDFSNTSKNSQGKEWNFKISSWNVDGIRAWLTKGGLDYIQHEKPDILCLQEVKCSQDKLPDECRNVPGYHAYWLCSDKDGYAGVGIYTTKLAMSVQYGLKNEELDTEGRIITAEYEHFYLVCTYVPNAGRKLVTLPKRLDWNEAFRSHVKELDKKKPVIICGDMNVAHNEIDLSKPKSNHKNAGFTPEERAGMTELLGDGFVDTYRRLYPEVTDKYTFWTYMMNCRAKNVGWRLDYFIVSERLIGMICDQVIRDQVYGSDHCPLSLFLHLTTADKPKEE